MISSLLHELLSFLLAQLPGKQDGGSWALLLVMSNPVSSLSRYTVYT
jgi:hypothetical protein